MLLRIILVMLMATGLAGFGAVAWISTRPAPQAIVKSAVAAAPANLSVLAAARTLRPGVLLKSEDIGTALVAASAVPEGARPDTATTRAELLGAMVRRTVPAGEPLLPIHVMRAGERGFLAAVLGPGLRATTVGVDSITGTAGLIWPGDHVDLILTETLDDPAAPLGRRIAGETVLHNVRVIAIDQELMQGATATAVNTNGGGAQSRTVTLEVTPENAERVAVATRLGHLSLSVISADTPITTEATIPVAEHAPITWGGDVSAALQAGHKTDPGSASMRMYEGGAEAKEIHF
jgi:pilus assembly protein CpaB